MNKSNKHNLEKNIIRKFYVLLRLINQRMCGEINKLENNKKIYKLVMKISNQKLEEKILKLIKDQKLSVFFEDYINECNFEDHFWMEIKKDIKNQKDKSIIMTFLTIEIAKLLDKYSIDFIFFKGVALSLQTTSSFYKRGNSNDLDLIISENDIPKVVEILGSIGFKLPNGYNKYLSNNLLGKYCRFIAYELTMYRDKGHQRQYIDLHWRFSNISHRKQMFKNVIVNKSMIKISDYQIPVMSTYDTFIYCCSNLCKDNFMNSRIFLDIERLYNLDFEKNDLFMRKSKLVEFSKIATFKLTKNKKLIDLNKTRFKKLKFKILNYFRILPGADIKLINYYTLQFFWNCLVASNLTNIIRLIFSNILSPRRISQSNKLLFFSVIDELSRRIFRLFLIVFSKNYTKNR